MKFILVNHRTPIDSGTCAECSRSLASGYLKSVSTRRQYCDYDCYVRYEGRSRPAPWLVASHQVPFDMITLFFAASCSYSIALAKAASRFGEVMATEIRTTIESAGAEMRREENTLGPSGVRERQ
ncbi:MAG: hypothetical protein JO022_12580 [Acidobacteriaceae bacterium]|nr:hypothetical protein [Acidobacteriaceae bacterium]